MGKSQGTDTDHPGDAVSSAGNSGTVPPKDKVTNTPKKAVNAAEAKKSNEAPAKTAEPAKKKRGAGSRGDASSS